MNTRDKICTEEEDIQNKSGGDIKTVWGYTLGLFNKRGITESLKTGHIETITFLNNLEKKTERLEEKKLNILNSTP